MGYRANYKLAEKSYFLTLGIKCASVDYKQWFLTCWANLTFQNAIKKSVKCHGILPGIDLYYHYPQLYKGIRQTPDKGQVVFMAEHDAAS